MAAKLAQRIADFGKTTPTRGKDEEEQKKTMDSPSLQKRDIQFVELFDLSNNNENDIDFNESNGIIEVVIYETSKCRGQKAKININQSVETKKITNLLKESLLY